jgi:hypothetical protein
VVFVLRLGVGVAEYTAIQLTMRRTSHQNAALWDIRRGVKPADFAREHGVSDSRIRQLLLEDRIFSRQKLGNGRWIMFGNSMIVAPYDRPDRTLRGAGYWPSGLA